MEHVLETIDVAVDENNELLFRVKVEGIDQAPAKVRLVCEGSDVSFVFNGKTTDEDGLIQFDVPPMTGKLKEGKYVTSVEVLVENRYFTPVQFNMNFKKPVSVVAESVNVVQKKQAPEIKVSAAPIIAKKKPTVQTQAVVQPANHRTLKERAEARSSQNEDLSDDEILEAAQLFVKQQRAKR